MSHNNLRTFVGLPVSEPLLSYLSGVSASLSALDTQRLAWVPDNKYHVTLLFLGYQSPEWLDDFAQVLDEQLYFEPQQLTASQVLPFPESSPKLLAAMLEQNEGLLSLHNDIKRIAVSLGFQPEKRRFIPHITLARKFPRHGYLSIPPAIEKTSAEASELVVYESQLHPDGAQYFPLYGYAALTYEEYDDYGYEVEAAG